MKKPPLDQATLRRLLHYDPDTGVFTWLHRDDVRPQWNGNYAGKVAGYARQASGGNWYWSIRIFDWPFHAGPLAWLYMTGEWPSALIDHWDGNGLNNRWKNLREADKTQNAANSKTPRNNTSGFKGAFRTKNKRRWFSQIMVRGELIRLGTFDSAEEAHAAYCAAAKKHFGDFARAA